MDETHLAHIISQTEYEARYDKAAKKLLANKIVLAHILKGCVKEYRDCAIQEIAEKYIEGTPDIDAVGVHMDDTNHVRKADSPIEGIGTEDAALTEGTVYYDVRFNAIVPGCGGSKTAKEHIRLIINVEAQNRFNLKYPLIKRAIYYCSRMISAQYGPVFANSEYQKLRKVYSIWVCTNPPKRFRNTITKYSIKPEPLVGNAVESAGNYDLINVVMICLGKPGMADSVGLVRFLEVLFGTELTADEKKIILEEEYDIPMTESFESEVCSLCNLSQGVLEKGMEKGIISLVEILKELGMPDRFIIDKIMEKFSLPEETAEEYLTEFYED